MDLQIMQWNCRSIERNLDQLLQFLSIKPCKILSLQSLNIKKEKLPKIKGFFYPPVYNIDKNTLRVNTAIYIKSDLNYIQVTPPIPPTATNISACAIKTQIMNTLCTIISIYLPKGPNDTNTEWLKYLNDTPNNKADKFIVNGDFNAHSPFWEKDCHIITSNRLLENIVDSNLILLNDGQITRIPDNLNHRGTAIDLCLVSPELAPFSKWSPWPDSLNSDHLPLILSIKNFEKHSKEQGNNTVTRFNYKLADWDAFNSQFLHLDADNFSNNADSIDDLYGAFTDQIIKAAKNTLPIINRRASNKHRGNPWWNSDCETARKEKWESFKHYLKVPSKSNLIKSKKAKNKSNRVNEEAKRKYWAKFCDESLNNNTSIQEIWNKIKTMKQGNLQSNYPIIINDDLLPSDLDKAEAFVKHFAINSSLEGLQTNEREYRIEREKEKEHSKNIIHTHNNINEDININITKTELTEQIHLLNNKKVSVGMDGISNIMIQHLPNNMIDILLVIFNKCWIEGCIPSIWKESIVVPIPKPDKSKDDINNYRPISLTSHISKLMERIIIQRLNHFCSINNIIPINQAGFRKGRSTTEHLVKFTTQIKQQFARRKNVLATFFDISKAFDKIWHYRLITKLKDLNLGKCMTNFIQSFIQNRYIQVRVGNFLSTHKKLDMGLPQGSVLSPTLFNIYMADLPEIFSKDTEVAQFADDISMWQKVTLKNSNKKSYTNYICKKYQSELDKIDDYLIYNGLSLSVNKTKLMLFDSGPKLINPPDFYIQNTKLNYSNTVKFLGVTFTPKLSWTNHFEDIQHRGRQALNIIKVVAAQKWGQNSKALRTMALTLVRSRLTYAQEIFFSAPDHQLKKLQSIDCKAFKLALGVPFHANNIGSYKEIDVLPLDLHRKAKAAIFIMKSKAINNFCVKEANLNVNTDFAKRSINIRSIQTIHNYTSDIIKDTPTSGKEIDNIQYIPNTPQWTLYRADFDIDNPILSKNTQPYLLKSLTLEYIANKYPTHTKIYTDGSKNDNGSAGAAFTIPSINCTKSFHLGNGISIFSAELIGIRQAFKEIQMNPINNKSILLCSDSKAALNAIRSNANKIRTKLLLEIQTLLSSLLQSNFNITLFWIPAHIDIQGNEIADKAAKAGANRSTSSIHLSLPLDIHEYKVEINRIIKEKFINTLHNTTNFYSTHCIKYQPNLSAKLVWSTAVNPRSRHISTIISKLRLNALTTKYAKMIVCICGNTLSVEHILTQCPIFQDLTKESYHSNESLSFTLNNKESLYEIAALILHSNISHLL